MKLDVTLTVRTAWGHENLDIIPLGNATPEDIVSKLKEVLSDKTLLIEVSIWNWERTEELARSSG